MPAGSSPRDTGRESHHVLVERGDGTRSILIQREERRNALDASMRQELIRALSEPVAEGEFATIIRSTGTVFCSGLDLTERLRAGTPQGESPIVDILRAIDSHPLPTIAVMQGHAVAGGCEMALACDFVLAANGANFSMPLVRLGLTPTWELVVRLVETLGLSRTKAILLAAEPISAQALAEAHVIYRAVDSNELPRALEDLLAALAKSVLGATSVTKAMITRAASGRMALPHGDLDRLADEIRVGNEARRRVAVALAGKGDGRGRN